MSRDVMVSDAVGKHPQHIGGSATMPVHKWVDFISTSQVP